MNKEANSTPLLKTTTTLQNPSELAQEIVSFRDDYIRWGRSTLQVIVRSGQAGSSPVMSGNPSLNITTWKQQDV